MVNEDTMNLSQITNHTNHTAATIATQKNHTVTIDAAGNVVTNGNLMIAAQNNMHLNAAALGISGAKGAVGGAGMQGSLYTSGLIAEGAIPSYLNAYPLLRTLAWNYAPFDAFHPVYDYDLTRQENQIHLNAWMGSDGQDVLDQVVLLLADNQPHLCFGSEDSRARFYMWLVRYQGLFGDQEIAKNGLPSLIGGRHSLSIVPLPEASMQQDRLIEYLIWISANTRSPFYYARGIMAFEDDADAFAFQMRFKGT
jgi:hypothetical protein